MPEEIIGSVWSECSVFVCLSHFIISDKSIKREMSLVRSGVSGEMSLGLPWSIRKYNYRSCFYENIILSWHIILWIGGKVFIWNPHVHRAVSATRQVRIAACNSHFPLGTRVTSWPVLHCVFQVSWVAQMKPHVQGYEKKSVGMSFVPVLTSVQGFSVCVPYPTNCLLTVCGAASFIQTVFLLNHALYGSHMCVLVTHRFIFM